ncbi:MAG: right-handed parallel beta-helix repeat-containing protein, partial [Chloroflexota bacterium]
GSGVRLNDGDNNQIGGTAAEGNIISGNDVYGINLHNGSNDNVIKANYIGTGQNLFVGLGNGSAGIRLDSSSDNSIGGTSSELGNIISDNGGNGILIANVSNTTLVQHNRIGVNANGTALPNDLNGVRINNSSRNSLVDNWIAYNSGDGINVTDTSQRNEIHRNNIHDNGLMGIDLDDDDVTNVNDPTDGDSGGNGLQNYPVIDTASIQTGVIEGQLLGPASTSFQIDFFRGDSCDPSGFGEGEVYLGTHAFSSDNSNEFTASNITGFGWGDYLTATATDDLNNTSEFSICFQCNEPLLMNLTISNNSGNIELLIIGNQNEDEFLIYRSINDPYFTPSTSYDQIIGNLWADGDNDEIGNVAENHFYLVRGQNECGYGGDSKRVGEFDFEIVPGS